MSTRECLRANDVRFLAVAATLRPDEWAAQSLCTDWTNREILAHLVVGYSCAIGAFAAEMGRHRGAFNPANAALAREKGSSRTPAELLADFAGFVERPEGIGRYFPRRLLLGDHVTHELDIVMAVDREPVIATDALVDVLRTQVTVPNPFVPAFANSLGLHLVATDAEWTHGTGPVVEGRAADLVSVLGNRPRALGALRGDGVARLSARVLSRQTRTAG
ncbi:hypothetical protein TUM20983_13880 [Mycobacterium antarcticum]|uniref:maleylpyruvate isomerase family mycothiol-dependent enzyme n=1 Tax=Mycolicibacterium sp. TUM20983 TaxID=3023369 RepID=UPI00239F8DCA|nr:maleylpyruvate isomerase family mycothiol-dependent enzyme [Mycolicibacterium sp. TUM20983]GLP74278.1 hypothetical protein TUM20983_13880 [Mycolicibacterium sp. TUM20983]